MVVWVVEKCLTECLTLPLENFRTLSTTPYWWIKLEPFRWTPINQFWSINILLHSPLFRPPPPNLFRQVWSVAFLHSTRTVRRRPATAVHINFILCSLPADPFLPIRLSSIRSTLQQWQLPSSTKATFINSKLPTVFTSNSANRRLVKENATYSRRPIRWSTGMLILLLRQPIRPLRRPSYTSLMDVHCTQMSMLFLPCVKIRLQPNKHTAPTPTPVTLNLLNIIGQPQIPHPTDHHHSHPRPTFPTIIIPVLLEINFKLRPQLRLWSALPPFPPLKQAHRPDMLVCSRKQPFTPIRRSPPPPWTAMLIIKINIWLHYLRCPHITNQHRTHIFTVCINRKACWKNSTTTLTTLWMFSEIMPKRPVFHPIWLKLTATWCVLQDRFWSILINKKILLSPLQPSPSSDVSQKVALPGMGTNTVSTTTTTLGGGHDDRVGSSSSSSVMRSRDHKSILGISLNRSVTPPNLNSSENSLLGLSTGARRPRVR